MSCSSYHLSEHVHFFLTPMPVDARTKAGIFLTPWLFVLHELEEYRTALPWIEAHASIVPSVVRRFVPPTPAFIGYAAIIFFVVFLAAGVAALRSKPQSAAWIILSILLVARLENALLHIIESSLLKQYTPGVLTAAILVLPVSGLLISQLVRENLIRRSRLPGIAAAGFLVQLATIAGMIALGTTV